MRRRDVLWWTWFAATMIGQLAITIWIEFGWEPPRGLFALMIADGLVLSLAYHGLGVRGIPRKRRHGGVSR